MSDTRFELVAELEHLLAHAKPGATKVAHVREIIERARRGDFHDFKSENEDMPKVALVTLLRAASLPSLAHRVVGGEFDERADDEDCALMAAQLKDHPKLRALLKLPDPGRS